MTDQPSSQPTTSDWASELSPELKAMVDAKGYKSPTDVVQAYAHAQRLIGAEKIPLPRNGEWDETAREKLGIPKTADGYNLNRPELPEGISYDESFEKAALPVAHQLGLTPHQLQGLVDFYASHQAQSYQSAARSRTDEQALAIESLRTEWGATYDTRLTQAARAARYFGGEALVTFLNESGVGNNPDLIRAFAKAGVLLGEDNMKSGETQSTTLAPDEALHKARALMSKPGYATRNHPDHTHLVEQVRQLFEQAYAA